MIDKLQKLIPMITTIAGEKILNIRYYFSRGFFYIKVITSYMNFQLCESRLICNKLIKSLLLSGNKIKAELALNLL